MEYKKKRRLILVIIVILLILLYAFKNIDFSLNAASFLCFILLFYFIDSAFKLEFPFKYYIVVILIATFGILLSPLFYISPIYDKILHLVSPILLSFIVFFMVDRFKIELKWKILITFLSILSLLTLFEIGEFLGDKLFNLKLQGVYIRDITGLSKYQLIIDKNEDTMVDISLGLIGIILFSLFKLRKHKLAKRKERKTRRKNRVIVQIHR